MAVEPRGKSCRQFHAQAGANGLGSSPTHEPIPAPFGLSGNPGDLDPLTVAYVPSAAWALSGSATERTTAVCPPPVVVA